MTLYLNFRSHPVGGSVVDPRVVEADVTNSAPTFRVLEWPEVQARVGGRNVLFGAHGFNVPLEHGARSLGQLEPRLELTAADVFLGVLWPGDYWIPVINYPFEGAVSMDCGRRLAACVTQRFASAQSVSFISHSLGARLVLEAVKSVPRPVRLVCLLAGAINRDCLVAEYQAAAANASAITLLASRSDLVLKVAFRIGDPISDLLHDDHRAFEAALGSSGPAMPAGPPIASPWQIPDAEGYGHGDYLPPGDSVQSAQAVPSPKWIQAAAYVTRALRSETQVWPV
ncbi:MAG: alpha/beta hydrolase [Steroidobacteraceae bacterium]